MSVPAALNREHAVRMRGAAGKWGAPISLAVHGDGTVCAKAALLMAHSSSAAHSGARSAAADTYFFIFLHATQLFGCTSR